MGHIVLACLLSLSFVGLPTNAAAADNDFLGLSKPNDRSSSRIRTYRQQPCSYWRFDSDVQGNICTILDSTITVPDAYDLVAALRRMQETIDSLERRVKELERN